MPTKLRTVRKILMWRIGSERGNKRKKGRVCSLKYVTIISFCVLPLLLFLLSFLSCEKSPSSPECLCDSPFSISSSLTSYFTKDLQRFLPSFLGSFLSSFLQSLASIFELTILCRYIRLSLPANERPFLFFTLLQPLSPAPTISFLN